MKQVVNWKFNPFSHYPTTQILPLEEKVLLLLDKTRQVTKYETKKNEHMKLDKWI